MDKERFKMLWIETNNMVSSEFRLRKSSNGLANVMKIKSFYCKNVVDGLWFSDSFASDYNQWIAVNINSDKDKQKIYQMMANIHLNAKVPVYAWTMCCFGLFLLIAGIICFYNGFVVAGIISVLIALLSMFLGIKKIWSKVAITDYDTVEKELVRIGDNIEHFLDKIDV